MIKCQLLEMLNCLLFQSRAQIATELLLELNEDVSGDYIEEVCIAHIHSSFSVGLPWKFADFTWHERGCEFYFPDFANKFHFKSHEVQVIHPITPKWCSTNQYKARPPACDVLLVFSLLWTSIANLDQKSSWFTVLHHYEWEFPTLIHA